MNYLILSLLPVGVALPFIGGVAPRFIGGVALPFIGGVPYLPEGGLEAFLLALPGREVLGVLPFFWFL
jgi:hypothetical protein